MCNIQELHLSLFLSIIFTSSSIVSVDSSINLSTNLFLHLQFSHSRLPGFQAYPLSHTPLLINSLHSHQHLLSVQRCLLLQTIASNLRIHLHFPCHFICLVSLFLDIRLNTLRFKSFTTSGTHIFAYGSLILLPLPLHLLVLILNG